MITDKDQVTYGRCVFALLNHGWIRPDGTTVEQPTEDELLVNTKMHEERQPLSVHAWPIAMREFQRLADEAGLPLEVALQ